MNNWGAVKLGLAVAAAGAFGSMRFSHAGASPHEASRGGVFSLLKDAKHESLGMISGAASNLDDGAAFGAGGGGRGYDALKAAARGSAPSQFSAQAPGRPVAQGTVRKIVRSASLSFEVKDQNKARALVRAVIFRNGAEIFAEDSSGDGDNQSGTIVIQAPPEKLETILKELEPLGRVVSRSITTDNRSEEYVDLKARLDNARKVEARLTELMSFKTNKLADILQLEHELERVGAEIEQLLGRMKYIDTLAATSRIAVRMAQPALVAKSAAPEAPNILTDIRNSLVGSLRTFVNTGLSLLNLTGFVLAIGLWTLPVVGLIWMAQRRLTRPE